MIDLQSLIPNLPADMQLLEKLHRWEWLLLLVGLLLFVGQAGLSSPQKSAAFDEEYHVAAGYAYLRTGDFRMSLSHPPLIDVLSAVPLLFRDDVALPVDHPAWAGGDYFIFSDVFLWQANDNPHAILLWTRWPIIILGAGLTLLLFVWARQLVGRWAGWLAFSLAVFDPNLLANSRLVTTDLGLAFMLTLAIWRLWCWRKRPSRRNLILAGIAGGLATASKFTGLLVWPMILLIVLLWWLEIGDGGLEIGNWRLEIGPDANERNLQSLISDLLILSLAGCFTVWAIYGFDVGRVAIPGLEWLPPIPAPFYPYSVWDTFMAIEQQPKTSFLLGQVSPRGWWYYFPVALTVKTPLPLLILATIGGWRVIRKRGWRKTAVLWLPPALFLALAMTGRITIGYRHILPLVPFLIMLAAHAGGRLEIGDWRLGHSFNLQSLLSNLWLPLLLLWHAGSTLLLYPHHEAFFNRLAGGPDGGDRVLVDSNIDWGQDLILLRRLMEEMGIEQVYLSYFGTALPEKYGVNYHPIPGFLRFTTGPEVNAYNPYTPPPGWYAISATSLRLGLLEQNVDLYAYFRDGQPVAKAGHSIYLYRVDYPSDMPVARTAVVNRAVADVAPNELGLYSDHRLIVKWLSTAEAAVQPPTPLPLSAEASPVGADFDGVFTLWRYELAQTAVSPGDTITLNLYWGVQTADPYRPLDTPSPATAAPLAAFVHLSGDDPARIVAQFDGWPTALTGLEQGDLIRQPVTLSVPPDTAPGNYFLRVGLYSPQTGQRLSIQGKTADYLTLARLTIGE